MTKILIATLTSVFIGTQTHAVELSISPGASYSSYYGFEFGIEGRADFSLTPRWQLGIGGDVSKRSEESKYEVFFGPTYNFSDQINDSFFVSFGVGYSNHYPDFYDSDSGFGYVDLGKRFLLSEKHQISYKPSIGVQFNQDSSELRLSILSFSMSF